MIETIPTIFGTNNSLGGGVIRTWDNCDYHHTGILSKDGKSVYESTKEKGVVLTNLEDFKIKYPKWCIELKPCRDLKQAYIRAESQIGKPYDKKAIYGLVLRRDWDCPDSWYCSEYNAYCMDIFKSTEINLITPSSIYRLKGERLSCSN